MAARGRMLLCVVLVALLALGGCALQPPVNTGSEGGTGPLPFESVDGETSADPNPTPTGTDWPGLPEPSLFPDRPTRGVMYARCPQELCLAGTPEPESLGSFTGAGWVEVTYAWKEGAVPNLPVFTAAICRDTPTAYSGAFNLANRRTVKKIIPFAGTDCRVKVAPSATERWSGQRIAIEASLGKVGYLKGEPFHLDADWTSQAVSDAQTFSLGDQTDFQGFLMLKLTTCSSEGGTSDSTASFACRGRVQPKTNSKIEATLRDERGVLLKEQHLVTWTAHHNTFTTRLPRAVEGKLVLDVKRLEGAAMLVHGPGSGLTGTR